VLAPRPASWRAKAAAQPQDLAGQRWVALSLLRAPLTWTFAKGRRAPHRADAIRRRRCIPPAALELVREGLGMSALLDYRLREDVVRGRLVRLLPDGRCPRRRPARGLSGEPPRPAKVAGAGGFPAAGRRRLTHPKFRRRHVPALT